ncbi:MAG TPA: hypothetical protein VJ949_03300 [Cryomorphaceae bacterium]|nr:hypothetical protein [Cryomorphaceae bacterium]
MLNWLKYEDLKNGMNVHADGGFTCMHEGTKRVYSDEDGFYLKCDDGKHYLDGQIVGDNDEMVGITLPQSKYI